MANQKAVDLQRWTAALATGNPGRIAATARDLAKAGSKVDTDYRFTVFDNLWIDEGGFTSDLMEGSGTDPRNDCPTAKLVLKGNSDWVDTFAECRNTMVGVTVETADLRFPFYVKSHNEHFEKGQLTHNIELRGIWDILNYYVIWPTWWLPIQAQPISHAVFFWALQTCLESMVAECALRLQSGIWEFVNNALSLNPDVRAWFGTLLQSNGNVFQMLKTPTYVKRTNPFLDTSPLFAKTVRMETCGTVIKDATKAYGVDTQMDLWLPGDPQPDRWANLNQPTYVFSTKDRLQIQGPTKTVLDSVLRTVVDLQGSILGRALDPILNPKGQNPALPDGAFEATAVGINFDAPYAIVVAPEPGEDSAVLSYDINHHTPDGWQHIIGGRCVSGDTLVHTADGLREAKSLEGQEVLTLSEGGVYRPAKWQSYGEQHLYRVAFSDGDEMFATWNHEWVVTGRAEKVTTLDLVGECVPRVAFADRFGRADYLAEKFAGTTVVDVEATGRIETVYCCEEPVTNTWVAGQGHLTGNSPKWLNDLFNATFAWLIDSLMIVVGFAGVPSDLLAGFMNNAFFAFQLVQHYERRAEVGPYHPAVERFYPTASSPYNIETLFAFINALFDSRGYTAAQVTINLAGPEVQYALGRDIFKGGLMSLVYRKRTKMITDYIENIMWRITPTERTLTAQIGDGRKDEAPLARHQRFITAAFEAAAVLTLSPQSSS